MTKPVILLVEDRPAYIQEVKDACDKDFEILVATKLAKAYALFGTGKDRFFAAVMDGCLEARFFDTGGLTRHIRRQAPDLPIVAYSSDPRINSQLRTAGCQYVIEKDPQELQKLLLKLVEGSKK